MISAVIIEDSRLARQELKELLKQHAEINLIGEADSARSAVELIRLLKPELAFLDIHLPGQNGFEILQQLDEVPKVIFTTAFDQYALQAFEHNALDYLLKPIVPERLASAISKVATLRPATTVQPLQNRLNAESRIFVKDGSRCWFIHLKDVRLFESRGNYTQLYFQKQSPMVLKSLQQLDEALDSRQFIRVNRQQIVNVSYIRTVAEALGNRLMLALTSGETVEVSRRQVQKFQELYRL
ncbi:LytR/AlgR family response regulator transcription factor [Mucilaginibacter sp.]|uniref:LytR/AlgR family response regulator transcription factor n=1 Tax=Mucilaginibacter sp. TaxID=1882438 RepID=UPI0035BC6891